MFGAQLAKLVAASSDELGSSLLHEGPLPLMPPGLQGSAVLLAHSSSNPCTWHPPLPPLQEDTYLIAAVEKYGTQRWSQISKGLVGRTSKACSHR